MLGRKGEGNIASPRMKRFDIITESDARVLDYGSTVVLAPGGKVTPLAADTLRSRRITVVRDAADVDAVSGRVTDCRAEPLNMHRLYCIPACSASTV